MLLPLWHHWRICKKYFCCIIRWFFYNSSPWFLASNYVFYYDHDSVLLDQYVCCNGTRTSSMCLWKVDIKFWGCKLWEFQSKTNLLMQNWVTYCLFWFWVVNKFSTCDSVCGCLFLGSFGTWMELVVGSWCRITKTQKYMAALRIV